jgi:alkylation response protein AidB-like acyl-CoA dehydrogenase
MTTIDTGRAAELVVDPALLARCRARAGGYDRANAFFAEDLAELQAAGYLLAPVPVDRGGAGASLAAVGAAQRELAKHAPATALALCMHLYWMGTAADLERFGDDSCSWVLDDAVAGEVFASGHAEPGNDVPVVLSTTRAERVVGGWRITGRKIFGSLGPVWTRIGFHAMDASGPDGPVVVHGFIRRDDPGVEVVPTWDATGMRATQSHDTVFDGVFVPDARVGLVAPAGDSSALFNGAMAAWALTLIANVYTGIAERAFELAVASLQQRTSIAVPGGAMATNPMFHHRVAEMYLELEGVRAIVDRVATDWDAGVDHGAAWGLKIAAAKWRAVEGAKRVVDVALDCTGGSGLFVGGEIERLARDVRCGAFHPFTHAMAHEVIGKAMLGIGGDGPRW